MNTNTIINTPFKIQGKKSRLLPFILDTIRESEETFETFVEPFAGSSVVGFNVAKNLDNFKDFHLSDINLYTMEFYNNIVNGNIDLDILRVQLYELRDKLLEGKSDFYYAFRDEFNKNNSLESLSCTEALIDFAFINKVCFNGLMRFNKKGKFNAAYCKNENQMSEMLIEKTYSQCNEMKSLFNGDKTFNSCCKDYRLAIEESKDYDNVLIYCDPPYIKRNAKYVNNDWNINDEIILRDSLINSGQKFIVSNWLADSQGVMNENVKAVWGDFKVLFASEHMYRIGNMKNTVNAAEILITNV